MATKSAPVAATVAAPQAEAAPPPPPSVATIELPEGQTHEQYMADIAVTPDDKLTDHQKAYRKAHS